MQRDTGVFTDNKLDQLYENVALGEPDSNGNKPSSQVWLFIAVARGAMGQGELKEALARDRPSFPNLNVKSSNARLCFQASHLLSQLSSHFIQSQIILHVA